MSNNYNNNYGNNGFKKPYTPPVQITTSQAISTFLAKEQQSHVSAFLGKALGTKKELGMANLMSVISNNTKLADCDPESVAAAIVIPTMYGLSISNGDVSVIPYGNSAQVQVQINGIIQLALRSGEYKILGATKVFEGDNKRTVKERISIPDDFVFTSSTSLDNPNKAPIGYYAYFKLSNGFEQEVYMSIKELEDHAEKYSKSWDKVKKVYKMADNDKMFKKTVLKRLITKFGPRNFEIQKVIEADENVYDEQSKAKMIEEKVELKQVQEMFNLIKVKHPELDTTDKRAEFVYGIIGREIEDWKELTKTEYKKVLGVLSKNN